MAYKSIIEENLVDYVIRGHGEEAIVKLANVIKESRDRTDLNEKLKFVPNLVYKKDEEIIINPFKMIEDMNALLPMNYDLVDINRYFINKMSSTQKRVYYVTSYGCVTGCTFCSEKAHTHRRWVRLDAERVVSEIHELTDKYNPERILFVDPNFSTDTSRVVEIVQLMKKRNLYVEICCDMRVSDILKISKLIDLRELKEVGFDKVIVGIESGSNKMLKDLNKNCTRESAYEACYLLDKANIITRTNFIHDFPGETIEDSDQTLDLSEKLCGFGGNRQLHHFFTPLIGTDIYNTLCGDLEFESKKTQMDWARTSILGDNELWPGRKWFRERVVNRLEDLKSKFPETFKHQVSLHI